MAEKPDPSSRSLSGVDDVKAPNVFERAKEEIEAIFHHEKNKHHHHKETHGLRDDLDNNTPMSDVKAPNVVQRAKEEMEAIMEAIHHPRKESKSSNSSSDGETRNGATKDCSKSEKSEGHSGKSSVNNNEIKSVKQKPHDDHHLHHHKETHGRREDIDENTPIGEIKGPSVFERAKEEIEALIETVHRRGKD
ncbi:uncharacterized protein LOC127264872 [Andrographis paniculata]|uniref:uncharacterized protein LOC127264872 n=1 Tax=Andrographis paniculata TaxID=175694 RepID=UPI0021E74556|nr:uncharacterized protein LOC127264872 [Andrographis paniculata]